MTHNVDQLTWNDLLRQAQEWLPSEDAQQWDDATTTVVLIAAGRMQIHPRRGGRYHAQMFVEGGHPVHYGTGTRIEGTGASVARAVLRCAVRASREGIEAVEARR